MIPRPVSEWLKRSWCGTEAPTAEMIQRSADEGRNARLRGFQLHGPGWYPDHRVLVTSAGLDARGEETFELRFYDSDPRVDFYWCSVLRMKNNPEPAAPPRLPVVP